MKRIVIPTIILLAVIMLYLVVGCTENIPVQSNSETSVYSTNIQTKIVPIVKIEDARYPPTADPEVSNVSPTPITNLSSKPRHEYTYAEKIMIAKIVYAESRGEPFEGQVAVAQVVINRYESRKFGKTVRRVAHAKAQFASGRRHNAENMRAVEAAIINRPLPENIYYFQKSNSKYWRKSKKIKRFCRIGHHTFYTVGKPKKGLTDES